ncbi:hypothetical protein P4H71_04285 [Paenibacillus kribbensis]|uniref:hypothetical protein n=1 Tax=Paenibacillus kribbensis TaxID=172713 RepID=UPI002DBA468F|nr:hypothetical protein [Paenibacillus kribbensis]MEC0233573.1 hypothetical protein [Paenibacillus kribbensis]
MTDKQRLIDADKLIKQLQDNRDLFAEDKVGSPSYNMGRVDSYHTMITWINNGHFDPDPPQQPNIQPGDRVVSISKPGLGTGVVVDPEKENLYKFTDRTWVRFGNDDLPLHSRTSDLELIQNQGEEV